MFSGRGALLNGGRWNSKGVKMVYCSESRALATLEIAVHLNSTELLQAYSACQIIMPRDIIEVVQPEDLPDGWDDLVVNPLEAQSWGDLWIDSEASAVVKVPSVVIPAEWNYLLNPDHPDFDKIEFGDITPLRFDPRIKGNTTE